VKTCANTVNRDDTANREAVNMLAIKKKIEFKAETPKRVSIMRDSIRVSSNQKISFTSLKRFHANPEEVFETARAARDFVGFQIERLELLYRSDRTDQSAINVGTPSALKQVSQSRR
jgi:hypothetical protein